MHHLRGMHRYTLEMIAMNHFPQAFREVVQAAILDRAMQASLEQEKKLNWCREVKKMVPLRTNGKFFCCGIVQEVSNKFGFFSRCWCEVV